MATLLRVFFLVGLLPWLAVAQDQPPAGGDHGSEVSRFIEEMVGRHGFPRASLEAAFAAAKVQRGILRAMEAPSTSLPWFRFRRTYIEPSRIRGGVAFWRRHEALISRASREYSVPPELIVATIGVETIYGRGELEQFLLLTRETGWPLRDVKGSYAGAIGIAQFLPSSYRRYAIDFDGDGRRNLRAAADAIGSVANYYRQFGWQPGQPVVVPVTVGDVDIEEWLEEGIKPHTPVGEYRREGLVPRGPVDDGLPAALIRVEAADRDEHYLALTNFYVITRYNRSTNYALVVNELAQRIRDLRETEIARAAGQAGGAAPAAAAGNATR
jgi:membrane-bound lytic murein transglycosylase B